VQDKKKLAEQIKKKAKDKAIKKEELDVY